MDLLWMLLIALGRLVSLGDLEWTGVLGQLDDHRAEALALGRPQLLDRVYAPGSEARDVDAALIKAYKRRGARVVGAEFEVLSCRVVRASSSRVILDVVDRLADSRAVWADGTTRALPHDQPTRWIVTLVHTSGGWRIAG